MRAYTEYRARRRNGGTVPAARPRRRTILRAVFSVGVISGTAGALAPILGKASGGAAGTSATHTSAPGAPAARSFADNASPAHAPAVRASDPPVDRFSEMYRGRLIEGAAPSGPSLRTHEAAGPVGVRSAEQCRPKVFIDGRPLHVMRSANGGYLSVVNHYEAFPTLLAAARAAVDILGPARLSQVPPHAV